MRLSVLQAPGAVVLIAAAAAGLCVSIYLTTVHYAHVPLACSTTGVVDCTAVTTSAYSVLPGTSVPITVPGMAWFIASGVLAIIAVSSAVTGRNEPRWLRGSHALLGMAGLAVVVCLIYVEAVRLHRLCEWCTALHVVILASMLVAVRRWQDAPVGKDSAS